MSWARDLMSWARYLMSWERDLCHGNEIIMSWERDPMSWERDKKNFTCPHSAAVIKVNFQSFRFLSILRDFF